MCICADQPFASDLTAGAREKSPSKWFARGQLQPSSVKALSGKLAQDGRLAQRFFNRRVAVAEPVLHQVNCHQRIGWTSAFTLEVMRIANIRRGARSAAVLALVKLM